MIDIEQERRTVERLSIHRPCKIVDARSGKYYGGTTCNVGPGLTGGALIRFDRTLALEPGDRISFGLCESRRHALIRSADMADAEVIRQAPSGSGETILALRFTTESRVCEPVRRAA